MSIASAKRKTRVCMFLNAPLAGDQRVFKEARTLADGGYEVVILCNQSSEDFPGSVFWEGIKVVSIPRTPSPFFPGKFTVDWLKAALAQKADIIHAHDLNTLGRGWLTARLTGAKLIYDSHDYFLETQGVLRMPRWRRWYYRRKEGFLIRRSDLVIHVVPSLCLVAAEEFKIPEPAVITNFPMGEPPPRSRVLHEMFGLAPETRIAIYEGVVVKDRALENLVQSGRHLQPDTAIVILGEGYLKEKLRCLATDSGVEDRVKFIDRVKLEDFPLYCAASDIGIAIYENEGLSWEHGWATKAFDYMRAGIPTVISGSRASEKLVRENDAGVVIRDISPEGIARCIADLLADRERCQRLGRNAARAWKDKFNWEPEGRRLLELYAGLYAPRR